MKKSLKANTAKAAAKAATTTPKGPMANPVVELHACMGLNACKGHDYWGTNNCAGMGYCATQHHSCHTLNHCKGQGGCGLFGTEEEQCRPGANDCSFQGSCGTPIPSARFVTQGPNQGKSVWQLARKLFAERMDKSGRTIGDSPERFGPTHEFLQEQFQSTFSCGYTGDRYCSFNSAEEAKERNQKFVEDSARKVDEMANVCKDDQV